MGEKCLVALGGNAILKHREVGTAEEQFENIRSTSKILVELIREGYRIAITQWQRTTSRRYSPQKRTR